MENTSGGMRNGLFVTGCVFKTLVTQGGLESAPFNYVMRGTLSFLSRSVGTL